MNTNLDLTKDEIEYLQSILTRYNREECVDSLFTEGTGNQKYIKTDNYKSWTAKQKKIRMLEDIIMKLKEKQNEKV